MGVKIKYSLINGNGNVNGNGFDMIEEVSLTIGSNIIETHTGQLLKDLSNNGSSNGIRFTIPLHFFYCRTSIRCTILQ
jgi:hypothetical protein